ncbi:hypothetical protein BC937DRAFT_91211 [Endogone sp. FLAS-F59071]|nr:hypothetical protein BC937DRAFT_91211 [Endogone sp. FLAS-F59071]|eukprot:RUS21879.1 hypothetical protein BC937DRAFT_91211 [Endogone sp. FLAS-F59071]
MVAAALAIGVPATLVLGTGIVSTPAGIGTTPTGIDTDVTVVPPPDTFTMGVAPGPCTVTVNGGGAGCGLGRTTTSLAGARPVMATKRACSSATTCSLLLPSPASPKISLNMSAFSRSHVEMSPPSIRTGSDVAAPPNASTSASRSILSARHRLSSSRSSFCLGTTRARSTSCCTSTTPSSVTRMSRLRSLPLISAPSGAATHSTTLRATVHAPLVSCSVIRSTRPYRSRVSSSLLLCPSSADSSSFSSSSSFLTSVPISRFTTTPTGITSSSTFTSSTSRFIPILSSISSPTPSTTPPTNSHRLFTYASPRSSPNTPYKYSASRGERKDAGASGPREAKVP